MEGLSPPLVNEKAFLDVNASTFTFLSRHLQTHTSLFQVNEPSGRPQYVVANPDEVHHVLVTHHKNYVKGRIFDKMKLLMGNGLIVQEGAFWQRQRKLMSPLFHMQALTRSVAIIEAHSERLLGEWTRKASEGAVVNVTQDVAHNVLHSLLEAIFGEDVAKIGSSFDFLAGDASRTIATVPLFQRQMRNVAVLVQKRAQQEELPPDLLSMLILARDPNGESMSLEQVCTEVATLIIAGHETTTALLGWIWYELAGHPDVDAELLRELEQDPPRRGEIPELEFTKMVAFECLRLYPPVWVEDRRLVADDVIGGHRVASGAEIFIPFYFIHRSARCFEDPDEFRPSRFKNYPLPRRYRREGAEPTTGDSAFFPFSIGPRRCIGDQYALINAQVHLSIIARQIKMTNRPASMKFATGVNLRPLEDIKMTPVVR
jgi:enediyne biosynthesis protein E7